MDNRKDNSVVMNAKGIYIDGKPEIIMCSSLFYFRIPEGMWRDRLKKVRAAGYNCIDVYFPWNYHEAEEGRWDFSGERNVTRFLKMASEEGLWVIARPGPYICSEWDGGAIPAYIFAKEGMKVRCFNENFLKYVREWYSRIMPILSGFQHGNGGPVIAVQIENELDFYNCDDVDRYMEALKDMAHEYGITVPLTACAGQCDVRNAGGLLNGVTPTLNLYLDVRNGQFENTIKNYYGEFKKRNFPVLITETHKIHSILRLELLCGAKFIGPYNQVGGYDFGFTTSVNNWGDPLSFMTHDYHHGGMVGPHGELYEEFFEARLLNGFIASLGSSLAEGEPVYSADITVDADAELSGGGLSAIKLKCGGYIAGVPNIDTKLAHVKLAYNGRTIPEYTELCVDELKCPFITFDVPMNIWGIAGYIKYSTAEVCMVKKCLNKTIMAFNSEHEGEICLDLDGARVENSSLKFIAKDQKIILCFDGKNNGTVHIGLSDGEELIVSICRRSEALYMVDIGDNGEIIFDKKQFINSGDDCCSEPEILWEECELKTPDKIAGGKIDLKFRADFMEKHGFYRGYGFYNGEIIFDKPHDILGYVIQNSSDVVSLYVDGRYIRTVIPGGNCSFIENDGALKKQRMDITIKTEIWGHTNFCDSRLPSMSFDGLRGISGFTAVTGIENLSGGWKYFKGADIGSLKNLVKDESLRPMIGLAAYNNPEQPQSGIYVRNIKALEGTDSWVLYFKNLDSTASVYVNGAFVKKLNHYSQYAVLDDHFKPGKENEVAIYYEVRYTGESKGLFPLLLEGVKPDSWSLSGADEKEMWNSAVCSIGSGKTIRFPMKTEPGSTVWLTWKMAKGLNKGYSYLISVSGKNGKVNILFNGRLLGRLWLQNDETMPTLMGGNPDVLYLPACFIGENNKIAVLVESMNSAEEVEIESIRFKPVKNEWVIENL